MKKSKIKIKIDELWQAFGDIPMNPYTECLEEEWYGFPIGTFRETIWSWFEEKFSISVAELMYGGIDMKSVDGKNLQKEINSESNIKTIFILDVDCSYPCSNPCDIGQPPIIYLIPLDKATEISLYAVKAAKKYNYLGEKSIFEYFEEYLKKEGIFFLEVGEIKIPYGNRQVDYIDDNILRQIV